MFKKWISEQLTNVKYGSLGVAMERCPKCKRPTETYFNECQHCKYDLFSWRRHSPQAEHWAANISKYGWQICKACGWMFEPPLFAGVEGQGSNRCRNPDCRYSAYAKPATHAEADLFVKACSDKMFNSAIERALVEQSEVKTRATHPPPPVMPSGQTPRPTPPPPPDKPEIDKLTALRDSCLHQFRSCPHKRVPPIYIHPPEHFDPNVIAHYEPDTDVICFNTAYLDRPWEHKTSTMIHELIHAWMNQTVDTNGKTWRSQQTSWHDKLFEIVCVQHGIEFQSYWREQD